MRREKIIYRYLGNYLFHCHKYLVNYLPTKKKKIYYFIIMITSANKKK